MRANGCRECSVCEGAPHHWLENYENVGDGPDFVCKHCDAVGDYYSSIEEPDVIDDEDDVIVERPRLR